jgi:hypothetical protein
MVNACILDKRSFAPKGWLRPALFDSTLFIG